jgi:hypothetical protein
MKNILIGWIDHLSFKDGETIQNTWTIHATRNTVA